MASPQMRVGALERIATDDRRALGPSRRAAARLLEAERSDEIFPVLLEEIVSLGFARALVAGVDFETGEIAPSASINFPRAVLQRFRTSIYASENALVGVLLNGKPGVLPNGPSRRSLYCHPIVFRS